MEDGCNYNTPGPEPCRLIPWNDRELRCQNNAASNNMRGCTAWTALRMQWAECFYVSGNAGFCKCVTSTKPEPSTPPPPPRLIWEFPPKPNPISRTCEAQVLPAFPGGQRPLGGGLPSLRGPRVSAGWLGLAAPGISGLQGSFVAARGDWDSVGYPAQEEQRPFLLSGFVWFSAVQDTTAS